MPKPKLQKRQEAQWRSLLSQLERHHLSWGDFDELTGQTRNPQNGQWMAERFAKALGEREELWAEFRNLPDEWVERTVARRTFPVELTHLLHQDLARRRSLRLDQALENSGEVSRRPRM